MIELEFAEHLAPAYQTELSAGADLRSAENLVIEAGGTAKVPTGVKISSYDKDSAGVGSESIVELQIRARSGLAFKYGITLCNGVGTVDVDYPDEICVLLWNTSKEDFSIKIGDRIAQMVLNVTRRIPGLEVKGKRKSGFGSTGVRT